MADSETIVGDPLVWRIQNWLKQTFSGTTGYVDIDRDGVTGQGTVNALLRAFQIKLGITNTSTNFGKGTSSAFISRFGNGIQVQSEDDQINPDTGDDIYTIILGALWCKGYATNSYQIDNHFTTGMGNAIVNLKDDAGLTDNTPTITLNIMKALLSMDQFKKIKGGTDEIRAFQRQLNKKYAEKIEIMPCDGMYTRQVNKAFIKILQIIEGYTGNNVDGAFGNGTKSKLPVIPNQGSLSDEKEENAIELIKAALCCNGYDVPIYFNIWTPELEKVITRFQEDMCINQSKICDVNTWMALLLSKGNPDRSCVACDTRFEMTQSRIDYLKNNGYQVVGRYLTNTPGGTLNKKLQEGEAIRIINNGLKLFLIFQESGTDLSYFTEARGAADARKAFNIAREYGIPRKNIIYFAVDTDPTDAQIKNIIIPYFKAVKNNMNSFYKVGVYATRNVCTQVLEHGCASSCFVSDMSTGFSGNMGFKMPKDWNLDQFAEIKKIHTKDGEPDMDIDKVAYSGKDRVVTSINSTMQEYINYIKSLEELYIEYKTGKSGSCSINDEILGMTNFLRSFKYNTSAWKIATARNIDQEFIQYVKNNNMDLYNKLAEYAASNDKALKDDGNHYIDVGHLAATIEGYIINNALVPNVWFGWAGDLATLMSQVDEKHNYDDEYSEFLKSAEEYIGKASSFGYEDINTDADAIKIAQLLKNTSQSLPFYSVLKTYYTDYFKSRISYYLLDLNVQLDFVNLKSAIYNKMTESFTSVASLNLLGTIPTVNSQVACVEAFANYIINNYPYSSIEVS